MQLSGEGWGYVLQCPVRGHGEDPRFGLRVPPPRLQGQYRYLNCQKILPRHTGPRSPELCFRSVAAVLVMKLPPRPRNKASFPKHSQHGRILRKFWSPVPPPYKPAVAEKKKCLYELLLISEQIEAVQKMNFNDAKKSWCSCISPSLARNPF